jgi:hypothetical protein
METKHYRITFENRPEYLYALVEGERDSYEISRQFWSEIAAECERVRPKRLLVEEDLKQQLPSIADTYQGAAERPDMGLVGIRIAFFDVHPDQHEQNQFGELVARNRGINMKVFVDRDEAVRWLLADGDGMEG